MITTICLLLAVIFNYKQKEKLNKLEIENTPYQDGYEQGFNAFCNQMGIEPKYKPKPSIQYTSMIKEETEEDQLKGYVDGYHRASSSMYCPRSNYSY